MSFTRKWDAVGKASRMKIMASLLRSYETDGENYDIPKLSREMGNEICLIVPRITSMLDSNLAKRKYSFRMHVKCLCMLLMTNQGISLAESSPNVIKTLVQALESKSLPEKCNLREKDLISTLVMLKKVCSLSERIRRTLLHFRVMSLVSTLQQKFHWSRNLQEAAGYLLLDLASVNDESATVLSLVLRKLLNSPQVYTKHAAVKMWSCVLCTNSSVIINVEDWETEALEQLTRLLLCSPLSFQYDVTELFALLFGSGTGNVGHLCGDLLPRLLQRVGAVLCLRYTLGGAGIVQPPIDWNMKFFSGYVIEAPEILVCAIVTTALKNGIEKPDLMEFDVMTGLMRNAKLHYLLMAHIFWYIRDKDIMQKVVNTWSEQSDNKKMKKSTKLRNALRIKMWLLRTSKHRFHTPEIKRASRVMSYANQFIRNKDMELKLDVVVTADPDDEDEEVDLDAQEMSCLSALSTLHWWMQIDPVASADIESAFHSLSFGSQLETVEVSSQCVNETIFVVDIARSMNNVFTLMRRNIRVESAPQLFGKTGARSVFLSKLLFPGQLVKEVKVALLDALKLEGEDHSALETALDDLSISIDPSFSQSTAFHRSMNQSSVFEGDCAGVSHAKFNENHTNHKVPVTLTEDENKSSTTSVEWISTFNNSYQSDDNKIVTENVVETAERSQSIKITDCPHRRSTIVATPRLFKGEILEEGRVPRWQDDIINHMKGKEHARKMAEAEASRIKQRTGSISPRKQSSLPIPSPPKAPKASFRYQRFHTPPLSDPASKKSVVPPPQGLPPPEINGENSILTVQSFIEDFLGESGGSSSAVQSKTSPVKVTNFGISCDSLSIDNAKKERARGSTSDSVSSVKSPDVMKPKSKSSSQPKSSNRRKVRNEVSDGENLGSNQNFSDLISSPETVPISIERSIDDDTNALSKPQTFALQMINELTELKGRGDDITPEESERLMIINKAINVILESEHSMVNDISDRLESIQNEDVDDSRSVSSDVKHVRDPLAAHYYNLRPPEMLTEHLPTQFENPEGNTGVVSYKKFNAYHRDKHINVLSELAAVDM